MLLSKRRGDGTGRVSELGVGGVRERRERREREGEREREGGRETYAAYHWPATVAGG